MWKQQAPFWLQGEYFAVRMRWCYGKAIACVDQNYVLLYKQLSVALLWRLALYILM